MYDLAVQLGGLALASILCHEIGHSLGLVPSGVPPRGLFAEVDDLPFTVTNATNAHIDTVGLNIMQTGSNTNWLEVFGQSPVFNPLNWAYLRRQLVIGEL